MPLKQLPLPHLEDPTLPRIPIPSLEETFSRYLEVLKPITSPSELQATKIKIDNWLHNKESRELQDELLSLAQNNSTSFLEGWWDSMYMEQRSPILINTNPYFRIRDDKWGRNQCERTANVLLACANLAQEIVLNTLPRSMEGKIPLCMSQFRWLFSSRIPGIGRDQLQCTAFSQHALVLCRKQFYKIPLYVDGKLVSESEITYCLEKIMKDAQKKGIHEIVSIGALTGGKRDDWANARERLLQFSKVNQKSFQAIDEALILVKLDESSPEDWEDVARLNMHSDGENIWVDKSLTLTICKNSVMGINMEHGGFDGDTHNTFVDYVYKFGERKSDSDDPAFAVINFEKLKWEFPVDILKQIDATVEETKKFISTCDLAVLRFSDFGKEGMKRLKISPDSFVQMAFQLAYYRLHQISCSTYEPMNVKRFYHGRTTTVRTCSSKSRIFTETFSNPFATLNQKAQSLRDAASNHVRLIKLSKEGLGIDRHMYGLHRLAIQHVQKTPNYTIPDIFTDPIYTRMKTDLVSTSNSSGIHGLVLQGFGPVTPEGYGLGYIYDDNTINVTISSFKNRAKMFRNVLEASLREMNRILEYDLGLQAKL